MIQRNRGAHLHSASAVLDVNNVPDDYFFFEDGLVDDGVEAQLLGAPDGLETNYNMRDCFAIPTEWILGFGRGEFGDLSLINFLGLLYPQPCVTKLAIRHEMRRAVCAPIARRNASARTSVFLTSAL